MATRFKKYFVSVKPNSFAQITEIAQYPEVKTRREFYKQLGKRKEAMTVLSRTPRKEELGSHIDRQSEFQPRTSESNPAQGT